MNTNKFAVDEWIDSLASALRKLAEAQEPYLKEYYRQNPPTYVLSEDGNIEAPPIALDDLRDLYGMARHSHVLSEWSYFAPLGAVLDPARNILRSHPTLARVVNPLIGRDEFYLEILNMGQSTSSADLVAGLMFRSAELTGDRYRKAAGDLHALLEPAKETAGSGKLPDGLDIGYDLVLFYGLAFTERIDVADGLALVPFDQVRSFVDERIVENLAPRCSLFDGWRSVGAVVRPFRWRPLFSRPGHLRDRDPTSPHRFFREAQVFLELLAVAQATPVLSIATLGECIDRSAGRLLGLEDYCGNEYGRQSAEGFDSFEGCPGLSLKALDQARAAFQLRRDERYAQVVPIVSRLSQALARGEGFAEKMRIVDVVSALENMYDLPRRDISATLQNRVSQYLGTDSASRERIKETVRQFYNARSNIVHGGRGNASPLETHRWFTSGFDIARRTLFKLLHEGRPNNWDDL